MQDPHLRKDPAYQALWIGSGVIFTLIMLVVGCSALAQIYRVGPANQANATEEAEPATAYLRGGRIVVVQLVRTGERRDHIAVYENALATRGFVPPRPIDPSASTTLPQDRWQAIDSLRAELCQNPPQTTRPPEPPYYDVGLQCGPYRVQSVVFTRENVPPVLAGLFETVPVPQ